MLSQPGRLFDLKPSVSARAVDCVLRRESGMRVVAGGRYEDLEGATVRRDDRGAARPRWFLLEMSTGEDIRCGLNRGQKMST
jgi:hypothetical protein